MIVALSPQGLYQKCSMFVISKSSGFKFIIPNDFFYVGYSKQIYQQNQVN